MNDIWRYRLGLLLVSASALAWSTAGYFTRLIPLDTWTLLFWRGLFGALALFLFIVWMEKKRALSSFQRLGRAGSAFAVVAAVGMVCFVAALKLTSVAHASVIYATVPLLSAGLAWLVLREKVEKSTLLASIAALIGVAVMVGAGNEGSLVGDLLALGMTFCMAIIMVIARHSPGIPMAAASCLSSLLSAAAVAPFVASALPDASNMMLLALFGIVNSALGLVLFAMGSKMLPAAETALIGALDAPLAPIWVMLAFGEIPNTSTMIGGTIVFAAILARMLVGNLSVRGKGEG